MIRIITYIAYAVFLLLCTSVYAQKILWEQSLGGIHAEYLYDAIPTADYGFLLAGSSLSQKTGQMTESNKGDLDYWLWKMDETGQMVWQKSFGGNGADLLRSVAHTRDGGFILGGTSNSAAGDFKKSEAIGQEDLWIIKLDALGNVDWEITIGGKGQDFLQNIAPTADGGYIVGATSGSNKTYDIPYGKDSNSKGGPDYWVIKLDSKGNIQWQQTYGGMYADELKKIIPTPDGGYFVAGVSNSPYSADKTSEVQGISDYWVLKLDKDGAIEWQQTYGGDAEDQLRDAIALRDGGFLLGGSSNSGSAYQKLVAAKKGFDFWVLKIDEHGNIQWQETYNTTGNDQLVSMSENQDGSIVLSGYGLPKFMYDAKGKPTRGGSEGENDYILLKINDKGDLLWDRIIGSHGQERLSKTIETRDGGYLLAGTSDGEATKDKKTNSKATDFWIVKLKDEQKKQVDKVMVEAFPNPTSQFTNVVVGFDFERATLTAFDISGRVLLSQQVTEKTIPVNLGGYPEGIYIIEVRSMDNKGSVKVIKSKR
jgi:hypothetical protein